MSKMRVVVEFGQTISMPGFENLKPCIRLEDDVEAGESLDQAYERVKSEATRLYLDEVKHLAALAVKAKLVVERSTP